MGVSTCPCAKPSDAGPGCFADPANAIEPMYKLGPYSSSFVAQNSRTLASWLKLFGMQRMDVFNNNTIMTEADEIARHKVEETKYANKGKGGGFPEIWGGGGSVTPCPTKEDQQAYDIYQLYENLGLDDQDAPLFKGEGLVCTDEAAKKIIKAGDKAVDIAQGVKDKLKSTKGTPEGARCIPRKPYKYTCTAADSTEPNGMPPGAQRYVIPLGAFDIQEKVFEDMKAAHEKIMEVLKTPAVQAAMKKAAEEKKKDLANLSKKEKEWLKAKVLTGGVSECSAYPGTRAEFPPGFADGPCACVAEVSDYESKDAWTCPKGRELRYDEVAAVGGPYAGVSVPQWYCMRTGEILVTVEEPLTCPTGFTPEAGEGGAFGICVMKSGPGCGKSDEEEPLPFDGVGQLGSPVTCDCEAEYVRGVVAGSRWCGVCGVAAWRWCGGSALLLVLFQMRGGWPDPHPP